MKYDPNLDQVGIIEVATQSHAFWGRNLTGDDRVALALERLHRADGLLHYAGIRADSGDLIASMKWYDVALTGRDGRVVS